MDFLFIKVHYLVLHYINNPIHVVCISIPSFCVHIISLVVFIMVHLFLQMTIDSEGGTIPEWSGWNTR